MTVPTPPVTKSQFMRGYDCPARLLHAREGLPSNNRDDDFLRMLAEGGFQFERLVRTAWPGPTLGGRASSADFDHERTMEVVRHLLEHADGVLHEASMVADGLFTRIDMLRVEDGGLFLCEIKATSIEGTLHSPEDQDTRLEILDGQEHMMTRRGLVRSKWVPYVADVAFQVHVAELALASAGLGRIPVRPRLIVVNGNATADRYDVFGNVELVGGSTSGGRLGEPRFIEPPPEGFRSPLIVEVDVTEPVRVLRKADAQSKARRWTEVSLHRMIEDATLVAAGEVDPDPPFERGWKCRDCEFRVDESPEIQTGFSRCWGEDEAGAVNLLQLYYGHEYDFPAPIEDGESWVGRALDSLRDLDRNAELSDLPSENSEGKRALTRSLQMKAHRARREEFSPDFSEAIQAALLPVGQQTVVHFVDFETAGACLPYTVGMKPYEPVPFQFSVHSAPWSRPQGPDWGGTQHSEWLTVETGTAEDPGRDDRAFIDHLMGAIGDTAGPVFHWAPHERTILRQIKARLAASSDASTEDEQRTAFIDSLTGDGDGEGRLVDMLAVAEGRFMTPWQRGSYSIKHVLPAVCRAPAPRTVILELMGWNDEAGTVPFDPYTLLPPIDEEPEGAGIRTGTDAMRAFQLIRFPGITGTSPERRDRLIQLLREYCKLDTAAMAAVWVWMIARASGE